MLNHTTIMGRLTADPETRYTQSNTPVTTFTVAVDDDYTKKAIFVRCVAWKTTAEFVGKYFSKGSMAVISGRLTQSEWEDKHGQKRRDTEITVENIYFGDSKKKEETSEAPVFSEFEDADGELPF